MAQIKFRLGERVFTFDTDVKDSMAEAVALRSAARDLDMDPARFAQIAANALTDLDSAGSSLLLVAYLCAVREDPELRWRPFLRSIPMDAKPSIVADDPPAAEPNQPAAVSVAAALTGEPPTT